MKHSLSLLAVLAATTLAAPASAQDMSAFLNPNALAANLGLDRPSPTLIVPRGQVYALNAPVVIAEPRIVHPVEPADGLADLAELMDDVADAAPYGANTAVILRAPSPRPTWFQRLFGL